MASNDIQLIKRIAQRASDLYAQHDNDVQPAYIAAELTFCHFEIVRLRLEDLLNADDGNFAHDIGGIHRHIDITGKRMKDAFCPRFAA